MKQGAKKGWGEKTKKKKGKGDMKQLLSFCLF